MDRFKFRGFDEDTKSMLYTLLWFDGRWFADHRCFEDYIEWEAPVMQATSLKDRNGKLIFEGDILRLDEEWMKMVGGDTINVDVGFKDGAFMLRRNSRRPLGDYDTYLWLNIDKAEIIGNIHEHPELVPTNERGREDE